MPFFGDPSPAPFWLVGPPGRWWNRGSEAITKTLKRSKTARRITPERRLKIDFEALDLHTSDGVRLSAWFVPGPTHHPGDEEMMVVLHHHYGGQKATLLPWIELFHGLGLSSLCFDARGHADSDSAPPGRGSFVRRSEDVRAACDELRRRGAKQILGFGQSQGAAALVIGVAKREDITAVIVDAGPAPDMCTAAWGLAGNMLGAVDSRKTGSRMLLAGRIIPGTHPARYLLYLWSSLWRLRRRPLLWIHGGRDRVIDSRWSGWWFSILRPRQGRWSSLHVAEAEHVRSLQTAGSEVREVVQSFVGSLEGSSPA